MLELQYITGYLCLSQLSLRFQYLSHSLSFPVKYLLGVINQLVNKPDNWNLACLQIYTQTMMIVLCLLVGIMTTLYYICILLNQSNLQ